MKGTSLCQRKKKLQNQLTKKRLIQRKDADGGIIRLSAVDKCLIEGNEIRINATVDNAKDETITVKTKCKTMTFKTINSEIN